MLQVYLVTRSGSDENFGNPLGTTVNCISNGYSYAGVVLLVLGFIPGMPKLSFFTLGAGSYVAIAYLLIKMKKNKQELEDRNRRR